MFVRMCARGCVKGGHGGQGGGRQPISKAGSDAHRPEFLFDMSIFECLYCNYKHTRS